jgi:hypothetical protein
VHPTPPLRVCGWERTWVLRFGGWRSRSVTARSVVVRHNSFKVSHLSKHHNIRFHNAIFQLLGVKPVFSSSAQKTIVQREKVCMTTFPASIKEWFSIEGVGKLFAENTTPDYLVELDDR